MYSSEYYKGKYVIQRNPKGRQKKLGKGSFGTVYEDWISTNKIYIPNRENKIKKVKFRLKTFFVVMFFAILNFEILFLVFSFFANLHFSSAQVPRDEKYKFTKNENTKNKISKFRIAKNITTKNVFRMCFYNFILPSSWKDE